MAPYSTGWARGLVRHLYIQNPFYLIGTLLILFGLQRAVSGSPELATSGGLAALLVGYTLLVAAIAAVVIRWGQVWEDARTILLVIVLLFFMLSTSLDVHLIYHPVAGTWLLLGGLGFAILLSECLLRGLRIGLATQYRLPFYLILALLFAWPLVPAWLQHFGWPEARSWSLFAFPSLAALALLTLLPAARTPAGREPATGTPWPWPYYPWSLFVYLTIGLALRTWWLTISFEPEEGLTAFFQPYLLFPLVLAWSALLLEMGRARDSQFARGLGMALPLCGLLTGFPLPENVATLAFTSRLSAAAASPAQLIFAAMLLFYGWAWLRRFAAAEGWLLVVGVLASFAWRDSFSWFDLSAPEPLLLAAVAGVLLAAAAYKQSAWRAMAGGSMLVVGFITSGGGLGGKDLWFWQGHAPVLVLMTIAAVFKDDLAGRLRQLAWPLTPALALVAGLVYPLALPTLSAGSTTALLVFTLLCSLGYWQRQPQSRVLAAAMVTLLANLAAPLRQGYVALERTALADGTPWLAGGLVVVGVALTISLVKMGLWQFGPRWLERFNSLLRGWSGERGT